jgi:hypothetical protein
MGRIRSAERTEVHPLVDSIEIERTFCLHADARRHIEEEVRFMPTIPLPSAANLEHLKHQARDLMRAHAERNPGAVHRIREFHPKFRRSTDAAIGDATFALSDAQLAIAREYGFPSWAKLKAYVEGETREDLSLPAHERIADPAFRQAVDLLDAGDVDGLRAHLEKHPGLVTGHVALDGGNYFTRPTLLEFTAENPTRHGRLPKNIVAVAKVILDAGAPQSAIDATLELVSSSLVARECGVQIAMIDLLCDQGADPNAGMLAPLFYGELDAVDELLRWGARLDLVVAAATGRLDAARAALAQSDDESRQRALALAAQHGHFEIVRLLLDAGENPDRYTPVGGHSHATPLHQAALAGHQRIVELLVERGARTDIPDLRYNGTPLGWAEWAGHGEVAEYLRAR